jgi:uncharacterized protein YbbK (DUF523 family)
MIVVSACLAGIKCRYDGTAFPNDRVVELVAAGRAIPVCPEVLGGLPIPRVPAEIVDGLVLTATGTDITSEFRRGAEIAVRLAVETGCREAILKARSPSCGSGQVYDGSFSGCMTAGDGIFAKMLKGVGFAVTTEEE